MAHKPGLAVVTGAAGGIGGAVAERFAKEGRDLILCDLRTETLAGHASSLRNAGSSRDGRSITIEIVAGDISVVSFPGEIEAKLAGREIDVLVLAAGVSPGMMTSGYRLYEINFSATKRLIEALLPHMTPEGVAIPIASIGGYMVANPLMDWAIWRYMAGGWFAFPANLLVRYPRVSYSISKRALQMYVQSMAPTFGKRRIVSVSPGSLDTDMGRLERNAEPAIWKMLDLTPAARFGTAEDIAGVVAFLASDGARYISGTDILVDGGNWSGIQKAGGMLYLVFRS